MSKEISAVLVLVVLLVLLVNPYDIWMPTMMNVMIITLLLVVFGLFASVILREGARDEREGVHRSLAGRYAFLVGSLILIGGISYQSFTHSLDIWLPVTLVAMILTKIATHFYSDRYL